MEQVLFTNMEITVIRNADGTHTISNGENRATIPALKFYEWCERRGVEPPIEEAIRYVVQKEFAQCS